jgi:hypothetical protein
MDQSTSGRWVCFSLINLSIVALFGLVMRYKIGFALPFFEQKFLQEAHSHFAFTGWISHTLYFLIVDVFRQGLSAKRLTQYHILIWANLITAYGMLVSFTIQGYGPVSLTFSTLSLLTAYIFSGFALKDCTNLHGGHPGKNWIKAALWFGILSTIGTMVLSWMMATRQFDQTTYLGSIYFYLHFQYNGWFIFGCFGLFMTTIRHLPLDKKEVLYPFTCFALAGIPSYFLSTLWADIPWWLYILVVAAALLQVIGLYFFIRMLKKHMLQLKMTFDKIVLLLFLVVIMAFSLKVFLQLGSTIPSISKLAFGFRPIVIAYLHLVLLLIVSIFLLTFLFHRGMIVKTANSKTALIIFTSGAILNEVVLAVQGIYSFSYTVVPYVNESLFLIALMMFGSVVFMVAYQFLTRKVDQHHPIS